MNPDVKQKWVEALRRGTIPEGMTEDLVIESKRNASSAPALLQKSVATLQSRGEQRDKPTGERSMGEIVKLFNTYTGQTISEADGWAFMIFLKMVRGKQGKFNEDDYIDGASYFALLGECESIARPVPTAMTAITT